MVLIDKEFVAQHFLVLINTMRMLSVDARPMQFEIFKTIEKTFLMTDKLYQEKFA